MNVQFLGNYDDNTIPDNGNNQFAYNDIWGYADQNGREYGIIGSRQFTHFIEVINGDVPLVSAREGRESLAAVQMVLEAALTGSGGALVTS